jgi:hypothetical protein
MLNVGIGFMGMTPKGVGAANNPMLEHSRF